MTRLRSPAQRAPQTTEAARALLEHYAQLDAQAALIALARDETISAAHASADAELVPIAAEQKDIVKQLKPWWAASIDALTGGKRKSIELGGCLIGYRISPPKVHFADGNDDAMAAVLIAAELADALVRTRHAPDKAAILRALDGDDASKLSELGIEARQREDFFVERMSGDTPAPVDVLDDQ